MGVFGDMLLSQAGATAGNAANGVLGLAMAGINDKRQLRQQDKLNKQQEEMAKRMGQFNYEQQMKMWEATNYGAQKEQMKKAGLNPALMYGMSGGGGGIMGGTTQAGSAHAPAGGGEMQAMMGMGLQSALLKAQVENIQADTEKKKADATLTSGAQTQNITADTDNKILSNVILKYAGEEAKEVFEKVKQPARQAEADRHAMEQSAAFGVAQNVYQLWARGDLEKKSNAEIESLLLGNSKTREETRNIIKTFDLIEENIKGARLSNIIAELEAELQTQTGIDRNSAGWLKILGRLFVGLGGRGTLEAIK